MHGFIKAAALSPKVTVANPALNAKETLSALLKAADDGVQQLSVFFLVEAAGKIYTVEFPGSLWEPFAGKVALRYPLAKENETDRYVEPEWLDALADALCTHDPG